LGLKFETRIEKEQRSAAVVSGCQRPATYNPETVWIRAGTLTAIEKGWFSARSGERRAR